MRPMNKILVLCAACFAFMPGSLLAQWDGGASQQLGMGHGFTALSQSTMRNALSADANSEADENQDAVQEEDDQARVEHLDALRQEYASRVSRDGAAKADAWAFEMGRRDASRQRD